MSPKPDSPLQACLWLYTSKVLFVCLGVNHQVGEKIYTCFCRAEPNFFFMRFILVNFLNFWQINDRQQVWSGQEKGSVKNAVNNGATMASKRLRQSVLVAIIYVNDGILCQTEVTIIHVMKVTYVR